jgi:hypothetical protein
MKRPVYPLTKFMTRGAGLLMIPFLLNGCIVGAMLFGGAAALVIKQGFIDDDTYEGIVKSTPGKVYDAAIEIMDELCHKIVLEKAFRTVSGSWKSADIEVKVTDAGGGEVVLQVKARRYMMADQDTALTVFQKIMNRLEKSRFLPP